MEEVRRAYGAVAAQYVELFGSTAHVHADDLALIERHLSIRPGPVIDLGCGPGHLTAHLRARDVDATGIDLVPELLGQARTVHPGDRYVRGSITRLPFPDRSAAGMLAWYSLIHVPPDDLGGVLAEVRRTMAPGGRLVVGFFAGGEDVEAFAHKVVTAYRWPVDDLAERLRQEGFTEVDRQQRPGTASGPRPHAALVATAT